MRVTRRRRMCGSLGRHSSKVMQTGRRRTVRGCDERRGRTGRPLCLTHAPNESVDPTEIASMALTEALFLQRYAAVRGSDKVEL